MTDRELLIDAKARIGLYALAGLLDVSATTIYRYFNGQSEPPRELIDNLRSLIETGEIDRVAVRKSERREHQKAKMRKVLEHNKANITTEDRRKWQKKAVEARLRRRGEA